MFRLHELLRRYEDAIRRSVLQEQEGKHYMVSESLGYIAGIQREIEQDILDSLARMRAR